MIGKAEVKTGLYVMILHSSTPNLLSDPLGLVSSSVNTTIVPSIKPTMFELWHLRLGHPSFPCYSKFQQLYDCMPDIKCKQCDICHFSKQKKLSFPLSVTSSISPFDLIHVDIWGPYSVSSVNGFGYFLTIVDDNTRFTWIKLMKAKSDT